MLGVVGGSGAGKSVLLRSIVGLNQPASGSIKVFGQETAAMDDRRVNGAAIALGRAVPGRRAIFSSQTVAQNIQVPMRRWTNMSRN